MYVSFPIALNADARIAMGQERYREAAKLFERQIFLDGSPSPDTLRAAAFCLEQTGQTGLALERITQAIAADPMGLRHYLAKAKLEGRMSRPGDGIVTLESLRHFSKTGGGRAISLSTAPPRPHGRQKLVDFPME